MLVVVVDELPAGLVFVDGGIVDDSKGVVVYLGQFGNGGKWNISGLNSTDVVCLWVSARVNVTGAITLTNKVNVTSRENDTEVKNFTDVVVVPVVLNVNKTV
uniref:hypothetical protein n=1 Tax=uncultured Methanobrevibacter sp. TaxID=253161 RepID=UPI0025FF6E42